MKGIFIEATPKNNSLFKYKYTEQNFEILEELKNQYKIILFPTLKHAVSQITADAKAYADISFMITNIPYKINTKTTTTIKAERKRLEGLIKNETEKEFKKISDENEFSAYTEAFDCFRELKQVVPNMKIIAYTAAHESVRKKVYDNDLFFAVHQRGHSAGHVWERVQLINGVNRALEGWRRCD